MKQAVILLGHGSIREHANVEVRGMWQMMKEQLPELNISGAFVEVADPTLEQEIDRLAAEGMERIIIVPMFLTRGQHLSNGIPRILDAMREKHGHIQIDIAAIGLNSLIRKLIRRVGS